MPDKNHKSKQALGLRDIPWVDRYMIEKDVMKLDDTEADRSIKKCIIFWHPDRFPSKFSKRFRPADYEQMQHMALSTSEEMSLAKVRVRDQGSGIRDQGCSASRIVVIVVC